MQSLLRRAAVPALLLILAGCSGGSGTGGTPPVGGPTATPTPTGVPLVPDAAARNAAQGALLAASAAGLFVPVSGAPRPLSVRRASSRAPLATVPCSNGFDEQDTATGLNVTHIVVSLYDDAGCTRLRQRATFDFSFGIDTSDASGTIVSYDAAGHATATQTVTDFLFFSGGGFAQRHSADAAGTSTTPFAHSSGLCLFAVSQCTLAAVTDGAGFETGVTLTTTVPAAQAAPGSTVTIPFTGSVRLGTPGSIAIVDQPFTPPALTGGGTPVAIAGTAAVTFGPAGPASFTLAMSVGATPVTGSLANGTATITVAGGTTAMVNADGDGAIRYANGATETIVDFRIGG